MVEVPHESNVDSRKLNCQTLMFISSFGPYHVDLPVQMRWAEATQEPGGGGGEVLTS